MEKKINQMEKYEEEKNENINSIGIGDVWITSSKHSLSKCEKVLKNLLKDKTITEYLNGEFRNKKLQRLTRGVG